jgi:predicted nucleic acid-binding protein
MAQADIFVDTAGFLALWDAADEHHARAVRLQADIARKRRRFLTTDYILDETATLLLVRHSHAAAADFLHASTASESLQLQWVDSARFHTAARLFERHDDKEWSFTDCVSFAVMHELNIQDCFTTDHHFRQAGFIPLLESAK